MAQIVKVVVSDTEECGDTFPIQDTTAIVKNADDFSKRVRIDASAISPNTVRTLIMPDADVDLSQSGSGSTLPVDDNTSIVRNVDDNTKQVRINASAVASGQIRTIIMPNANVDLSNVANAITSGDNISLLNNDTGFITIASVPTLTSQLTNDSGFITSSEVPTLTSQLTNDSGFLSVDNVADAITLDTSGFSQNLDASIDTIQKFADRVDILPTGGGGGVTLPVDDTIPLVQDPADNTKRVRIDAGGLSTNNVRSIIMPDADVDLSIALSAIQPASNISLLNNDAGFITISSVPTLTSQLTNDNGFITSAEVPTLTSQLVNDSGFITLSEVGGGTVDVTNNNVATSTVLNANLQELDTAAFNNVSTGVTEGGDITSLGAGVVRIAAGSGQIINNSVPGSPVVSLVSWPETDLDLSAFTGSIFIFVDATGTVQFNNITPDEASFYNSIHLWAVGLNAGVFLGAQPTVSPTQQLAAGIRTIWSTIGPSKKGFDVLNTGNDLTIGFAQGTVIFRGVGFFDNPQTPDQTSLNQVNVVTFRHVSQDGTQSADTTILDVSNFDDGGVLTPIPGATTRATIIQLHAFLPGGAFRFLRGQQVFTDINEARNALVTGAYSPIVPENLNNSLILGWVIAQSGATNLSDGTQQLITSVFNQNISVQGGSSGISQDAFIAITQGANTGFGTVYRLNNESFYNPIGEGAIDFTLSTGAGIPDGMSGDASVGFGLNVRDTGLFNNLFGNNVAADGNRNNIFGRSISITGLNNSIIGGDAFNMQANNACIHGHLSRTDADRGVVIGVFGEAFSFGETSVNGLFGTQYTPGSTTVVVGTDRLFNIGKGEDQNNRSDALTILKDNRTGIGFDNFETATETATLQVNGLAHSNATIAEIESGTDGTLVTKSFSQSFFDNDFGTTELVITTDEGNVYASDPNFTTWEWGKSFNQVIFSIKARGIDGTTQTGRLAIDISQTNMPRPKLSTQFFDHTFATGLSCTSPNFNSPIATFVTTNELRILTQPSTSADRNTQSIQDVDFDGGLSTAILSVSGSYIVSDLIGVVMAGQSNMSGRDALQAIDTVTDPKVFLLDGSFSPTRTPLCVEPTHAQYEAAAGVSPGLAFGKRVSPNLSKNQELLMIPTAVGGTSIANWINDDTVRDVQLLTNFTENVQLAQRMGVKIKAVLWQQGRSDSNNTNYAVEQDQLFAQFRAIVGDPNLTIIFGNVAGFGTSDTTIVNQQKAISAAGDPNGFLVDTLDLNSFDGVHYNAEGSRTIGERMADVFVAEAL